MSTNTRNVLAACCGSGMLTMLALLIFVPTLGPFGFVLGTLLGAFVGWIGYETRSVVRTVPLATIHAFRRLQHAPGTISQGAVHAGISVGHVVRWIFKRPILFIGILSTIGMVITTTQAPKLTHPWYHPIILLAMLGTGLILFKALTCHFGLAFSTGNGCDTLMGFHKLRLGSKLLQAVEKEIIRNQGKSSLKLFPDDDFDVPMRWSRFAIFFLWATLNNVYFLVALPIGLVRLVGFLLFLAGALLVGIVTSLVRFVHSSERTACMIYGPSGALLTYAVLRALNVPVNRGGDLSPALLFGCCLLAGVVSAGLGYLGARLVPVAALNDARCPVKMKK